MSDSSFKDAFCVVGAIIENNGKILLVQEHMPGKPEHGMWNQPAGWVDLGEDPLDAIVREVREETGLEFKPQALIGIYSLFKAHLRESMGATPHPVKFIFAGDVVGGKLIERTDEIAQARWFTPEEIFALPMHQLRDADIIDEVRDYIHGVRYPLSIMHHRSTDRDSYTQLA